MREGGRRGAGQSKIDDVVALHYDEPTRLSNRIARPGYQNAAKVLQQCCRSRVCAIWPLEILAAEAVPAFLDSFEIPIKRLRWSDGRESALRGEDLIGVARKDRNVRFLKANRRVGRR